MKKLFQNSKLPWKFTMISVLILLSLLMFNPQFLISSKLETVSESWSEKKENSILIEPFTKNINSGSNLSAPYINLIYLVYYSEYAISIDWEDILGAIFYEVYRSATNMNDLTSLSPIRTINESQYFESISVPGDYYYMVVAIGVNGESAKSNQVYLLVQFYEPSPSTFSTTWPTHIEHGFKNWTALLGTGIFVIGLIFVIVILRRSSHPESSQLTHIPETTASSYTISNENRRVNDSTMIQPINLGRIKFCGQCGTRNDPFSNYCIECGNKLNW